QHGHDQRMPLYDDQSHDRAITNRGRSDLTSTQVRDVLTLISSAPDSELYRCFIPGWGIRAHSATDLLFQIAFCFQCHGARLWGPGVPAELDGIHGFDPDSPPALELLQRFRGSTPGRLKRIFRRS
ncbi:hypothetical protein, partial [Streptomyces sp. NPDC001410]|uniref:hypothetical protein n=1 Tax=Streptomyces sp. NPDC001410 TaxID=3364574 RepID=UPI00368C9960